MYFKETQEKAVKAIESFNTYIFCTALAFFAMNLFPIQLRILIALQIIQQSMSVEKKLYLK